MAVLPRRCFAYTELAAAGSATVNYRPIHWVGGARCLIEAIVTGKELFALEEKNSSISLLETFKQHRITHASFSPMTLRRLKSILIEEMEKDPEADCGSWFGGLSAISCGGSMVELSMVEFWSKLTGLPFEVFYSATELGGPSIKGNPISAVSRQFDSLLSRVSEDLTSRKRNASGPLCQASKSSSPRETAARFSSEAQEC